MCPQPPPQPPPAARRARPEPGQPPPRRTPPATGGVARGGARRGGWAAAPRLPTGRQSWRGEGRGGGGWGGCRPQLGVPPATGGAGSIPQGEWPVATHPAPPWISVRHTRRCRGAHARTAWRRGRPAGGRAGAGAVRCQALDKNGAAGRLQRTWPPAGGRGGGSAQAAARCPAAVGGRARPRGLSPRGPPPSPARERARARNPRGGDDRTARGVAVTRPLREGRCGHPRLFAEGWPAAAQPDTLAASAPTGQY